MASAALQTLFKSSMESVANGKTQVELEYVIYAKLANFDELLKAARKEEQEQWEIRRENDPSYKFFGSVRIRAVNNTRFILCCKTLEDGQNGKDEVEMEVTKDFFVALKKIATGGMRKTRYFFPIAGSDMTWEVDVYYDANGQKEAWCKIDLEVKQNLPQLPSLPVTVEEKIDAQPLDRTPEERARVDDLLKNKFVLTRPYPRAV